MSPPPPDKPIAERISAWVHKLPDACVQVIVSEGTADTPCGELAVGSDRDLATSQLAELLAGIVDAAGKMLGLVLSALDASGTRRLRMVLRLAPEERSRSAVDGDKYTGDPAEVIKMALSHADGTMRLFVDGYQGLLSSYEQAMEVLSTALGKTVRQRDAAEDAFREARALASDAVEKAEAETERGSMLKAVQETVGTKLVDRILERVLGTDGEKVAKLVKDAAEAKDVGEVLTGEVVDDPHHA
jgi:hypothetical protein